MGKNTFLLPLLLLLGSFVGLTEPYKILMYTNLFGHSHIKMLGAVSDTLTDAGHDLTVLMPVIDFKQENKTAMKSTKNIIKIQPGQDISKTIETMEKFMTQLWTTDNSNPLFMVFHAPAMSAIFASQCRKVLEDKELIERLRAENFDLAITEPFDTCAYALFEAIKIRAHVAVLSCSRLDHVSKAIGQPIAPSYVPGTQSTHGERMTIWQRFMNILHFLMGDFLFSYIGDEDFKVAKEIIPGVRSWREVLPEASFIFTNHIPLMDFPAPTFDKIIPIGGISVKTQKKSLELPEKWNKILGLRKKNILVSFGSNARSADMPEHFKQNVLKVAESMPDVTFIWKYENEKDTLADHLDNVYLGDWLPQNELLGDPRLSLFVTHGGLASVTELALMGKPAVMVPLFADQARNANMLKRHGGAAVLHKTDLGNAETIRNTIKKVLENEKYRVNAERLAEMLNNQPTNPKDTLIKHVEFAAKFGQLPSMDPYGRHQSYIEYYLLDIISIALVLILTTSFISFQLIKCTFRMCCGSGKVKKD
ncbi:UDP-glucuronosyltransferase [Caenorhabditis elegans]|uniref:UDP-glucuronosyltransferase n=1 Tax=Caenorhabditis elegans TaxID=6239 RepID=Q9U3Q6_CAEEL|nr:UDP-glucuronosyltransferase [Caenorhabditis elegans]CAB62783.1 UDP-glucuronosyltransferase [Caenorhabditis elegans]|eukprot:NP_502633.1 UDP-glucuronosyltransferase [Caenorhabditis elegans]